MSVWLLIQKFDMNTFYSFQKYCIMSYPVLDKSKTNSSFHLKCHLSWVATTATHSKSFEYFIIVFDDQDKRQERSYVMYDGWSSKIWFSWVSFHLNYTRIVNPKHEKIITNYKSLKENEKVCVFNMISNIT